MPQPTSFCRCAEALCGETPAIAASSPAGSARPSIRAPTMASRAGSASAAATAENPAWTVTDSDMASLAAMVAFLQELNAEPAPIDAMVLDQAVLQLHDLDKVDLLALIGKARVFPHQLGS